ncbi:MAG: 3-methyl-2-oxobutanoate hydroxymethyltransferase [Planctomycetota bacterium]
MADKPHRMTVPRFMSLKAKGQRISMLTAYDFPLAKILDEAGVDAVLVGDTVSMVVQGHDNTLHVTLDDIIYHAEMVGRAVHRALVVVDMPFPTFQISRSAAIANAARILQETRCQAVKLEGTREQADTVAALVGAGIPVMGHVGLRPQTIHQMGGYKIHRDTARLLADARAIQDAGAFALVLECVPAHVAAQITEQLTIPTIGIGAGPQCDGQVLVAHDLLGLTSGRVPRFVHQYANVKQVVHDAVSQYCRDVTNGTFPGPAQTLA